MTTTKRYCPDPILHSLTTSGALLPPTCPQIRMDVVRLTMSRFAQSRCFHRLASVFYSADEDALKGLLLVLGSQIPEEFLDPDPAYYAKSYRDASAAFSDRTFLRLASVASDVLDWDGSGEWEKYVIPAWNVLCDEVEFEREEREANVFHECEYYSVKRRNHQAYSKEEAQAQGIADARRWDRDE